MGILELTGLRFSAFNNNGYESSLIRHAMRDFFQTTGKTASLILIV
jgi:hypothetical protein